MPTEYQIKGVKYSVNAHSSIRLCGQGKVVYIDPFMIDKTRSDADVIFITHPHYDHFCQKSIDLIAKQDTLYVCTADVAQELVKHCDPTKVITVSPNESGEVADVCYQTFCAYNAHKPYHLRTNNWVGYTITLDNVRFTYLGDTDDLPSLAKLKCDVLFVPIGGKYTMDGREGAQLAIRIAPALAVPVHYGSVVGDRREESVFVECLDNKVPHKIVISSSH